MAITDLFSTSFLFSIAIIIILIGGIFAYVSYRMSEQDHKLTSMVNLVSILAQDLHLVKGELRRTTENTNTNTNIQYSSDIISGGDNSGLINVSDEEYEDDYEDDDDDEDDDEEISSEEVSLDEEISVGEEISLNDEEREADDEAQEKIKILNLSLTNEAIDNDNDFYVENLDNNYEMVQQKGEEDIKTIHLDEITECEPETDKTDNLILKNIKIIHLF